jgi:hypothetical protein
MHSSPAFSRSQHLCGYQGCSWCNRALPGDVRICRSAASSLLTALVKLRVGWTFCATLTCPSYRYRQAVHPVDVECDLIDLSSFTHLSLGFVYGY